MGAWLGGRKMSKFIEGQETGEYEQLIGVTIGGETFSWKQLADRCFQLLIGAYSK